MDEIFDLIESVSEGFSTYSLTSWLDKRTQAFEMKCFRRLLNISYKDHITIEDLRRRGQAAIREYDERMALVKKRKLKGFAYISGSPDLAKAALQGTVNGKRRGRQKRS